MNLAIIVSVSDYIHELKLAACDADAKLVRLIIDGSNRFDHVIQLSGNASSIKSQLSEFIRQHKGAEVAEVFFYYTGHGTIDSEDFCYLFADYSEDQHSSTSLSNRELDDMLRSLSPSLVVKVVDACHSGIAYVKEASMDFLEKTINNAKATFRKCYFMFSSQSDEVSYQDDELSDFTRAFAEAVCFHKAESVRYADVLSGITDYFSRHGNQRPTFVTQADHTELFLQLSDDLRSRVEVLIDQRSRNAPDSKAPPMDPATTPTLEVDSPVRMLVQRLKTQAASYCTEDRAHSIFEAIKATLTRWSCSAEFGELYELKIELSATSHWGTPSTSVLGKWVKDNPSVFASVSYTDEEYEAETKVQSPFSFLHYDVRTVTRTRRVISNFENTAETPFYFAKIAFVPKLINLNHWSGYLFLLCSKSRLHLFSSLVELRDLNWTKQEEAKSAQWARADIPLADIESANTSLRSILQGFEVQIVRQLGGGTEPRRPID